MSISPGLYVVATPIGNLGDITLRAIDVLKSADLVLCEDTRVAGKLFAAHGIDTAKRSYHDHNAERARPEIIARLKDGAAIALVSDAGTPLISDPGYKLVREARAEGLAVHAVPGPSALTAALSVAGLPTDRVLFAGFPPQKAAARSAFFDSFAATPASLVFYETGPRLAASLTAMADAFGDRDAAVVRELTKTYEEARLGRLSMLARQCAQKPPKGEIVVIVARADADAAPAADLDALVSHALETQSVKDAAAAVAAETGFPKKTVYARALALKNKAAP
ncbi:MAG: 16S rRNA (cytidine(1402)-2'-O)-methyltransferase [Pseudomonadota bacterium]